MFEMKVLVTVFVLGAIYFAAFYVAELVFMKDQGAHH